MIGVAERRSLPALASSFACEARAEIDAAHKNGGASAAPADTAPFFFSAPLPTNVSRGGSTGPSPPQAAQQAQQLAAVQAQLASVAMPGTHTAAAGARTSASSSPAARAARDAREAVSVSRGGNPGEGRFVYSPSTSAPRAAPPAAGVSLRARSSVPGAGALDSAFCWSQVSGACARTGRASRL